MAGRNNYEPTPADRATVKSLSAAGVNEFRICQCIGTHGISEKTLRKYFRRELDVTKTEVTASAMSQLAGAISRGEEWAIKLWLKAREDWSEPHRLYAEHTGKDGRELIPVQALRATLVTAEKALRAREDPDEQPVTE